MTEKRATAMENLIGVHVRDPQFLAFLRHLGEDPHVVLLGEDDLHESAALVFEKRGLEIAFDKGQKINAIHVFSAGVQGYGQYTGVLPRQLAFQMSRKATRALLGPPSRTGGPVKAIIGEDVHYWDRWDYETFVLHVQYPEEKNAVTMLTLISLDRAPE